MSYFLWIEDFDNSTKTTASNVLGNILDENLFDDDKRRLRKNLTAQGVFIELSFQDGLAFIRQKLHQIDYVILDINLPAISDGDILNEEVLKLLTDFQGYQKQTDDSEDERLLTEKCKQLREIAGFYLYTELLVELGFPKQHILFCSNHGEEVKSIKEAFAAAKIALPPIHEKAKSDVKNWVKQCRENPYSVLRRGIIEGCKHLKTLTEDNLRFNDFISEDENKKSFLDIADYVGILENFLPLQEPKNKTRFYKLFARTLAHEWEDSAKPRKLKNENEILAFSWIMKMSRNWMAHSNIFNNLTEQEIAFLFICNMRAMFDLGDNLLGYEKKLLSLFYYKEIKAMIGTGFRDRKIPLIQNYAALLHQSGKSREAINYHDALNQFQKYKTEKSEEDVAFLITGLYQTFWFITSNGFISLPKKEGNLDIDKLDRYNALNYQFGFFDYGKSDFLLEFSSYIYKRSFLSGE